MGPIDYTSAFSDVPDPSQAYQQGVESRVKLQAVQQQQMQQQAALQRQQLMQTQLAALSRNPTPQAIAQFSIAFPELGKQMKESYDMLAPAQQQAELKRLAPVFSAVQAGKPDIAIGHLNTIADSLESAGKTQDAREARDMAKLIETNPSAANSIVGTSLAAIMGPDKFATTFQTIGQEKRATELQPGLVRKGTADAAAAEADATTKGVTAKYAEKNATADLDQKAAQLGLTKAEVRNINSQIGTRAAQLKLDGQKLQLEVDKFIFEKQQKLTDIGQDGRKLVNDAAVASGAAKLSADRANTLADQLETLDGWTGVGGSFSDWLKKATGSQDAVTELRTQYIALRNTEGLKNLPPGPATDKDVALAMEGIPPATANPKVMQSWLRGMAKLNDISAAVENARADYASNNKGLLGKARTSFQAGGVDVVPGDSWVQTSKRVAEAAARKYTPAADRVQAAPGSAFIPGSGTPEARAQDAQRAGQSPGREVSFNDLRN